uniref:Protein ABIL2-1 n=1 Tax=Rhizophora mucronata TaxID=61149 RepID=A0A2P2L5Q4_RHIMU
MPVGLPLQVLQNNGTLQSLENQLQCISQLKRKSPKTLNNIPARVNVFSRPYLAGANQRKMKCCILIWMNIERGDDDRIRRRIKRRAKCSRACACVEFDMCPLKCNTNIPLYTSPGLILQQCKFSFKNL